jgi:hypothetical protein
MQPHSRFRVPEAGAAPRKSPAEFGLCHQHPLELAFGLEAGHELLH